MGPRIRWVGHGMAVALWIGLGEIAAAGTPPVGSLCDEPVAEECSNGADDDADGWIDCLDPDCVPAGSDVVCGPDGVIRPACRPLLGDSGSIRFKLPLRLDFFNVSARAMPLSALDPQNETVRLLHYNAFGEIFSEVIVPGSYVPNAKGLRWKLKRKKTGSPMIYQSNVRKESDGAGAVELFVKFKTEADLWFADPLRNTAHTEAELRNMTTQISIGDDAFFINADWERCGCGWNLD